MFLEYVPDPCRLRQLGKTLFISFISYDCISIWLLGLEYHILCVDSRVFKQYRLNQLLYRLNYYLFSYKEQHKFEFSYCSSYNTLVLLAADI